LRTIAFAVIALAAATNLGIIGGALVWIGVLSGSSIFVGVFSLFFIVVGIYIGLRLAIPLIRRNREYMEQALHRHEK
jgi:hypothetical protein